MRNEESVIEACLASVLANTVSGHSFEVLVLDGESEDRSGAIVDAIAAHDPRVRRLLNPARIQASAFNLGLSEARGRFIVRMDAHSLYAEDYLAESVRLLETTGASNVGGVQRAVGRTWLGRTIAAAVSSKFAAGDAAYRNATSPSWTDTVYLGAWRKETLVALGGMREGWAVNEDYEMNVRLRSTGGKIYLAPSIRSTYFVRPSLAKLAKQYTRYGFWKVRTLLMHPSSLRWRQLVAPAFVLSIACTPFLVGRFGVWGWGHLLAYLVANLAASVTVAANNDWKLLPGLPVVFATVHLAWGSGFLAGCVVWPWRRGD